MQGILKGCERWIDQHDTSVGQRKNESPTGIEPMISRTPGDHGGCSIHCATRTYGQQGHLTDSIILCDRRPIYC